MAVEARFECKTKLLYPPMGTHDGEPTQQCDVELQPVTGGPDEDDPNSSWSRWTPSGKIEMTIMNPDAHPFFEPGQEYRVVFTKHQPQKAR